MVSRETTGVYLSFQFQMNKNEIELCEFEMHFNFSVNFNFIHSISIYNFTMASTRIWESLIEAGEETHKLKERKGKKISILQTVPAVAK